MKISEYPVIEAFAQDDFLLADGDTNGTRRISAANAVLSALNLNSHYVRRTIFRGANLGTSITPEQKAAIRAGTFENLWLGDYWEIGGVKWRIVDFDYWYGFGDTKFTNHHLVVMPDTGITNSKMNDTSVTTGGYTSSVARTTAVPTAKVIVQNAFGDAVLSHREFLTTTVSSGYPSAGAWTDSDVELPNEPMIYGSYIYTPGNTGSTDVKRYTISSTQLALFRAAPSFIVSGNGFWLRDVVSASHFARVDSYGGATSTGAANEYPIRPIVPIG